jgi:hypothetical protein
MFAQLYHGTIADGMATNFVMTISAEAKRFENGSMNIWTRLGI